MLDENNLVTYAFSDEWYSVDAARRTMRRMTAAIDRGDLQVWTALNPTSAHTNVAIVISEEWGI
jgi:hypothetical protein